MSENLQKIIDRVKAGNYTQEDVLAIVEQIYAGKLVISSGAGAVGIGGAATDSPIVTGDGNIIIYGADARSLELALKKNGYQDLETIKRIVREELLLSQKEYGNPVSQGLKALAELMRYPEARSAVITFKVEFQMACEQIDIIANYKEVHDLLHTLEFQCYNGIVQESRQFPNDETALEILTEHELTLQNLLGEVKEVAGRETIATKEVLWLKDLERARSELQLAIEELNTRRLQQTIWLLNRVLAIQPSRINTNLNSAAKTLRLPELVNAMKFICNKLPISNLNREKICQFHEGVEVLSELNERLTALLSAHDYWQELDLELRRIEANLKTDSIELEMSWMDLKERTNVLFNSDGEAADSWTISFQKDMMELDTAIDSKNPANVKRCFRKYRRRASDRFYQVDVKLKRLCEELREVGEPLASVLRIIE